jgi:hypothetical protein
MKMLISGENYRNTPIDPHFFCGMCKNVADDPRKCQNCEDVFSESCIKKIKETTNECPACKKAPFKDIQLSRYERIKLNESEFICYKCKAPFFYEDRHKHLAQCPSLQGLCPAGSGITGINTE